MSSSLGLEWHQPPLTQLVSQPPPGQPRPTVNEAKVTESSWMDYLKDASKIGCVLGLVGLIGSAAYTEKKNMADDNFANCHARNEANKKEWYERPQNARHPEQCEWKEVPIGSALGKVAQNVTAELTGWSKMSLLEKSGLTLMTGVLFASSYIKTGVKIALPFMNLII